MIFAEKLGGDCGYYSIPTNSNDCITCATGYEHLVPVYTDGTGSCWKSLCYALPGRETLLEGCECDSSCSTCGYFPEKVLASLSFSYSYDFSFSYRDALPVGAGECIECADDYPYFTAIYEDGTGTCTGPTATRTSTAAPTSLAVDSAHRANALAFTSLLGLLLFYILYFK